MQHRPWCDQDSEREEMTGRCASPVRLAGPVGLWLSDTERDPMAVATISQDGARLTADEVARLRDHCDDLLTHLGHPAAPPRQRVPREDGPPAAGGPHVPPAPREP